MYNTQVYRIKNLVSNSPILYTVLKTAWVMMSTSWADMHVWNLIASTLVVPVLRWGSLQLTNDLVLGWQQITTNLGVSTTPQVCHIFLVSWFYVWTVLQVSEQATKLFCLNKFVCHVSSVWQACLCIFCKQALFPLFLLPKFQQSHITNSEFFHSIRCVAKQSD